MITSALPLKELIIPCRIDEILGLNLVSLRSPSPPPQGEPDEGIFVRNISPTGTIAKDGRLKPGDRLLVANSEWLMGLELQEVAEVGENR